jgi:hypothetical protein
MGIPVAAGFRETVRGKDGYGKSRLRPLSGAVRMVASPVGDGGAD